MVQTHQWMEAIQKLGERTRAEELKLNQLLDAHIVVLEVRDPLWYTEYSAAAGIARLTE